MKKIILGSAIAALGVAAIYNARRWSSSWGVDPLVSARPLPGDDIVPEPVTVDTRVITIDATPEAVWPWLVQMGFERGGWYSWDSRLRGGGEGAVVPEIHQLAVGDTLPTHAGGGFEVKVLEPNRELVLYLDSKIVGTWAPAGEDGTPEVQPGGRSFPGSRRGATPPEFAASWAFVLEPTGDGGTRLVERVRAWFGPTTPGSRAFLPVIGFGAFVMIQKQMVGLRDRVERAERERLERAGTTASSAPVTATQAAPPIRAASPKLPNGPDPTEPGTLPA